MRFALIGAAGYVAPRHMKAIKELGGELVAALDLHDSVGILDSYFPKCEFFTEPERFDRHLSKLQYENPIDYVSICSPNYLHDAHCRLGLRAGADIICEKPLVINPWNLNQLKDVEKRCNKKIYTILQLRLHPEIIKLKDKIQNSPKKIYHVQLSYITPRGLWYHTSWKGDQRKSGGVALNIGVHFFDMLLWLFGKCLHFDVHQYTPETVSGKLHFSIADVNWFLSIDPKVSNGNPYRKITVNNEELRFDNVFSDLHTVSYQNIINGNGFGIDDVYETIDLIHEIRNSKL